MTDLLSQLTTLQAQVTNLESTLSSQSALVRKLEQSAEANQEALQALVIEQVKMLISHELPEILASSHPKFSAFLSQLKLVDLSDNSNLSALLEGDHDEISDQQIEQIIQSVSTLLQDTIQQQIIVALRGGLF